MIDKDLKNVTLISAAEQVGRSPSSVSRLFLEATGTTFTDYLTARRMEKANELLSCIEYKIYEVSEMVGYSSPKNFARAYKKYFGRTPREFRGPKEGGRQKGALFKKEQVELASVYHILRQSAIPPTAGKQYFRQWEELHFYLFSWTVVKNQ